MNNQVIVNPGLYDLPDEVLLPLMITLNDTTLLDMTRVCKRFQAIAKEAFVKKYHGTTKDDFYGMRVYSANMNEQLKQYHPFFSAFGENMIAIKIRFLDDAENVKDHWINGLIQRYCTSLAKLVVYRGDVDLTGIIFWLPKPTLTHLALESMSVSNYLWADYEYSQLICFHAVEANIDQEKIEKFIGNNRQLEELRLVGEFIGIDILEAISGKLNELKRLTIQCYEYQESPEKSITIELRQLQELEIHLNDETCEPVLQSIAKGCKNVEQLEIEDEADCLVWNEEKIDAICEFVKLKSLQLCATHLTVKHIKRIVQKLPNLTSLTLSDADEIHDKIPQIISICSKLNSIELHSESLVMPHLNSEFLCGIAETTDRNTSMKVTLEFGDKPKKIFFTQEEVRCENAIVYWSGYVPIDNQTKTLLDLSDECLMKIIGYLDINAQAALYTTCTKTQRAIKDHLSTTVFHVPDLSNAIDEDAFQSLAPSIHKIIVIRDLRLEQWEHINLHCTSLIELNMAYSHNRDLYR
ncbi:uncharacterized protein LOC129565496 isoform X3 [Sitodiplosis mosellana]|uniref:uncharacterized protein LOC129565496 isoform X3 n=1 Tax=Sitodiplosis mosellana TaxID=263140 RepID=UPI002444A6A8|nr:uncharacterized protein LOC129565496 isoform X3 [Sitodiplosis mosellana]